MDESTLTALERAVIAEIRYLQQYLAELRALRSLAVRPDDVRIAAAVLDPDFRRDLLAQRTGEEAR